MKFNPSGFIDNLKYMGIGMLGVFLIVGIIIFATFLIGKLPIYNSKNNKQ